MQKLNKIIASFLLLVLSVFIVPKELLHELHHHDTIHQTHTNDSGTQVDKIHHHCIVLQLSAPPFLAALNYFNILPSETNLTFYCVKGSRYFSHFFNLSQLRGPPAVS